MKCTIIISVLESHEIFRRQMLRFRKIMPPNFELIIFDDGSQVPLEFKDPVSFPFRLIPTNDRRPWTQNLVRNIGADLALGEYLLMTDIDHVLTPEALNAVSTFRGDMLKFARRVGCLDQNGSVSRPQEDIHPHVNTFAIKKALYKRSGGYDRVPSGYGDDRTFRSRYQKLVDLGEADQYEIGPRIYVIKEQKWFHDLSREL